MLYKNNSVSIDTSENHNKYTSESITQLQTSINGNSYTSDVIIDTKNYTENYIEYSVFNNIKDNTPKQQKISLYEFIKSFSECKTKHTKEQKELVPGWCAATFNGSRNNENVITRTAIVLDIDSKNITTDVYTNTDTLLSKIRNDLVDIKYFIHTTISHTYHTPSFRIIIFLKEYIDLTNDKKRYRRTVENFISNLSFKDYIDDASCKAAQMMFFPTCNASNPDYQYFYEFHDKEFIDISKYDKIFIAEKDKADFKCLLNKIHPSSPLIDLEVVTQVASALYHAYNGNKDGLSYFDNWTKKAIQKYNEEDVQKLYYNSTNNNTTIYSIQEKLIEIARQTRHKYKIEKINEDEVLFPDFKQTKARCIPTITPANLNTLFCYYGFSMYFDVIKKTFVCLQNEQRIDYVNFVTLVKTALIVNDFINITRSELEYLIHYISKDNQVNTFKDLVCSKSWDGQDRVSQLIETVKVLPCYKDLRDIYIRQFLKQLIHVTCFNDKSVHKGGRYVLVFQGVQGAGKTSWFRNFMPSDNRDFFLEGCALNLQDRMSKLACVECVLVELGELDATFSKSDISQLKAFISSTTDQIDKKYVADVLKYRRTTCFCASVNDEKFLVDTTGSTRFNVLKVQELDYQHNIDMQQVFAQVYSGTNYDDSYDLTKDQKELQKLYNEEFTKIQPIEEAFVKFYDVDCVTRPEKAMNATEIVEILGFLKTQANATHVNQILAKYKCEHKKSGFDRYITLPPKRVSETSQQYPPY